MDGFIQWITSDIFNALFLTLVALTLWLVYCQPRSSRAIASVAFCLPSVVYYYALPSNLSLLAHYSTTAAFDVAAILALSAVPKVTLTIIRIQSLLLLSICVNLLDAIVYVSLDLDGFEVLQAFFVFYYATAMAVLMTRETDDGFSCPAFIPSAWVSWSDSRLIAINRHLPKISSAKKKG